MSHINIIGDKIYVDGILQDTRLLNSHEPVIEQDFTHILKNPIISLKTTENSIFRFIIDSNPNNTEKIIVRAPSNQIEIVEFQENNGKLVIDAKKGNYSNLKIEVIVGAKAIQELDLAGLGDTRATIISDYLSLKNKSNGNIILKGKVDDIEIHHAGSGNIHAQELNSENLILNHKCNGDLNVNVNNKISGYLRGNGNINITGEADVKIINEGLGKVTMKKIPTPIPTDFQSVVSTMQNMRKESNTFTPVINGNQTLTFD